MAKLGRDERGLIAKDRAVMNLLLRGKSRADICGELNIPLGTVNYCCTKIYKKMGCKNLPELLVKYCAAAVRGSAGNLKNNMEEHAI